MAAFKHIGMSTCAPSPGLIGPSISPPLSRRQNKLPKFSTVTCSSSKWAERLLGDFQFFSPVADSSSELQNSLSTTTTSTLAPIPQHRPPPPPTPERYVSIPLDFYKVLGAETHFLGDGIRRAYQDRVSKPPAYGFSQDALISRRQILQAACDTLANFSSRREYNHGLIDDEEDTILTQVPWDNAPGALCVLQEAGETEVVLEIGEALLKERLAKAFKQDVVLVMALAYVDMSRNAMALDPPDFIRGSDMLEKALKLLQEEGASSLAPDLQAQIDETLEEITPRYVLELLALPLDDKFRMKREEGLQGVRNILWAVGGGGASPLSGGFTREDFMKEAFLRMTSSEQVDLFVATPPNIPPQNFEVHGVALALIAQAFMGKKPQHVPYADNLFEQLQQTKASSVKEDCETEYSLGRGLCSLLLGELGDCHAWLGLEQENSRYRNPAVVQFVLENSDEDDEDYLRGLCKLLETWLMDVVFPRFRDTSDVAFRLGDYYDDPAVLSYLESREGAGRSPLAAAAAIVRIGADALQRVFPLGQEGKINGYQENGVINYSVAAIPESNKIMEKLDVDKNDSMAGVSGKGFFDEMPEPITEKIKDASVKIISAGVAIGVITLVGLKYMPSRVLFLRQGKIDQATVPNSTAGEGENSLDELSRMNANVAEGIIRNWQSIKSQAFGPDHCLGKLTEVLDGQMLKIWTDRAAETAKLGWEYDFCLLDLTIKDVTMSSNGQHAVVEATIKESITLTDAVHPNQDPNTTTYSTRYELSASDSGWRITEGALLI
ncbi:Protein ACCUMULATION AND REPLICATION OF CHLOROPLASTS 6, chloroplastic [Linum grandiflorum]